MVHGGDITVQQFNSRRAWCQTNLGKEHEEWHHLWTNRGYVWRFRTQEAKVMFQMVWL